MLDIRKVSLMLQSGHKSRRLDFIFDFFMECVKFIFYVDTCLLLLSNSFFEMIDANNNDWQFMWQAIN